MSKLDGAPTRTNLASFGDPSFRVVEPRLWNPLHITTKVYGNLSASIKALNIFKAHYH